MKKRLTPKTKKIATKSLGFPNLSPDTIQWEKQNLPLIASFVIIAACFVIALAKLSVIKPKTVYVNSVNITEAQPSPVCNPSPDVFSGIGARLEQVNSKIYIQEVIPGSPAEKNEIMSGDVVYRVDNTPVVDVNDAVSRIRGEVGAPVRLVLYRENLRLDKTIVRENITDEKTIICK